MHNSKGIDFKFDQQTEVDNNVYVNMFINAYNLFKTKRISYFLLFFYKTFIAYLRQ